MIRQLFILLFAFLISITGTTQPGEYGFSLSSAHQTSYGMREEGRDWTGNSVYLWAIANAVYMSLLGPQGFREVGELILQQVHYAARAIARTCVSSARAIARKSDAPTLNGGGPCGP